MPGSVTAETYENIDAATQSTDSALHDDDIHGEFLHEDIEGSEEVNDIAEEIADGFVEIYPSICNVKHDIDVTSRHCLLSQKGMEIRRQNIKLSKYYAGTVWCWKDSLI